MINRYDRRIAELEGFVGSHIEEQMSHYESCVKSGSDDFNLHHSAHRQTEIWMAAIQAVLSDPTLLSSWESRHPDWTKATLEGLSKSLLSIQSVIKPILDPLRTPEGAIKMHLLHSKDVPDQHRKNITAILAQELQ